MSLARYAAACAILAWVTPLEARETPILASAALRTTQGSDAGFALLRIDRGKPFLSLTLHGVPEGDHGLHLHAVGSCEGPTFTSAGPHLNPGGHKHGVLNPDGTHLGDLPNVTAGADGTVLVDFGVNTERRGLMAALFDADGTAIVVHASPDDYKTDPSGNSGARIACGVFRLNI